ncbi:MAG: discoidin domain-containing protein, partial [Coprobacter sp.]
MKNSCFTGLLKYLGILFFCIEGTIQSQNIVSPISFVPDQSLQIRNLALNRAAYHSSCSNFDYTAHLITDGNTDVQGNPKITVQYSDFPSGESPENLFDGSSDSKYLTFHSASWIQYEFANGASYVIDRYVLTSANDDENRDPKNWTFLGSNDGKNWILLDTRSDIRFSRRKESLSFTVKNTNTYKMYRFDITDNRGDNRTQLSEIDLFEKNVSRIDRPVFSSKWESAGKGDQWVYIDLGTICRINKVKLFWGEEFARSYQIQFSADKSNWRPLYSTNEGKGGIEEINLTTATAKYVRLYMTDGISER